MISMKQQVWMRWGRKRERGKEGREGQGDSGGEGMKRKEGTVVVDYSSNR